MEDSDEGRAFEDLKGAYIDIKPSQHERAILAGRQLLPREMARLLMDDTTWEKTWHPRQSELGAWESYRAIMTMIQIIYAESLAFTEAVGPLGELGAFQLHPDHGPVLDLSVEEFKTLAFEPLAAVVVARSLYVYNSPLPSGPPEYTFKAWAAGPDHNGSYDHPVFARRAMLGIVNHTAEADGHTPVPLFYIAQGARPLTRQR